MHWTEIVGHTGAALSSITFIPQVYKAWQTKSVGNKTFARRTKFNDCFVSNLRICFFISITFKISKMTLGFD